MSYIKNLREGADLDNRMNQMECYGIGNSRAIKPY